MRLRLRLEFVGTGFIGWQLQSEGEGYEGAPSIQATVERALGIIFGRPRERIPVQGCARTDTGVHAEEFFCHLDLPLDFNTSLVNAEWLEKFRHSLNGILPPAVAVTQVEKVAESFHALQSIKSKSYEYRILLRRTKPTLLRGFCCWLSLDTKNFNVGLLSEGLKILEGTHDFKAFAASNSTAKTTVRKLYSCSLVQKNLGVDISSGVLLKLKFKGNGFLKQMLRTIAGTLIEIAQEKRTLQSLRELLESGAHRTQAGFCAPAEGLFLVEIDYGAEKETF